MVKLIENCFLIYVELPGYPCWEQPMCIEEINQLGVVLLEDASMDKAEHEQLIFAEMLLQLFNETGAW